VWRTTGNNVAARWKSSDHILRFPVRVLGFHGDLRGAICNVLSERRSGRGCAEYALLLSLIGTAIAFAGSSLGTAISTAITNIAALL